MLPGIISASRWSAIQGSRGRSSADIRGQVGISLTSGSGGNKFSMSPWNSFWCCNVGILESHPFGEYNDEIEGWGEVGGGGGG